MTDKADPLQVSHRKVWTLAAPIILSNISVPLVGAVDTAVVGHLPGPEFIGTRCGRFSSAVCRLSVAEIILPEC